MSRTLKWVSLAAASGALLTLGGCVVAPVGPPPGVGVGVYAAPVVVAPRPYYYGGYGYGYRGYYGGPHYRY